MAQHTARAYLQASNHDTGPSKSDLGFPPLLFPWLKWQSGTLTALVSRSGRLTVFVSPAFYGEQNHTSEERYCQRDNNNLI
jgi:hypothetical protein